MPLRLPAPRGQDLHWRCAYQLTKPALRRIPVDDLIEVEVDIWNVARVSFGKMARIRSMRSVVAENLPDFDLNRIDQLDTLVRSMCYAHWLYQSTRVPLDRLRAWLKEAAEIQQRLLTEIARLNSGPITDFSHSAACPNLDRCQLTTAQISPASCLLRWNWSRIEARTTLRRCEIARAELVAELVEIVTLHGDNAQLVDAALTLNRQRAFTLFLRSYDQIRRAMQFIRWNIGDADDIAPPLYAPLERRRRDSGIVPRGECDECIIATHCLYAPGTRQSAS